MKQRRHRASDPAAANYCSHSVQHQCQPRLALMKSHGERAAGAAFEQRVFGLENTDADLIRKCQVGLRAAEFITDVRHAKRLWALYQFDNESLTSLSTQIGWWIVVKQSLFMTVLRNCQSCPTSNQLSAFSFNSKMGKANHNS